MLGSPPGRFCRAVTNPGICVPSFCCIEVIDDELSIMNRTSRSPGLAPVAAAVRAAVVDATDGSTFGCAHDAAVTAIAIASPVKVVEETNLGELDMQAPLQTARRGRSNGSPG